MNWRVPRRIIRLLFRCLGVRGVAEGWDLNWEERDGW